MTPAMPSNAKPKLTPKLRFPEFRNKPAWSGKPMGEVYSFKGNNSFSRDQLNYEHGSVKNIHYGDIHTKFSTLFDITKEQVPFINPSESLDGFRPENDCVEGDMIFADASEDLADVGKSIELIRLNGERVVSGQHTILARPNGDSLVVGFGAWLFKSKRVRTQIQKESQGAKVLGISATRLTKIELPIPTTKAEQQKIAECLGTLDELMGAESQKLDALKAYKKGLMQQLFPRAGETRPRLRFPEFKNAPEWEASYLGDVATFTSGGTPSKDKAEYWNGSIPWISASSMYSTRLEFSDLNVTPLAVGNGTRIAPKGSLLILVRGSMLYNRVPMGIAAVDVTFNQDVKALVLQKRVNTEFLLLQLLSGEKRIPINETGIGAGKIDTEDLKKHPVYLPAPAEQRHIADCLSALDELIASQSAKLAALQSHKQGLMQQLFPSPSEAAA